MADEFRFLIRAEEATADLQQGDILRRTPELQRALDEAHSFYARAGDYSHFLVLSQTCDLVRYGDVPKTDYITICAVRPFSRLVAKISERFGENVPGFPIPTLRENSRPKIRQKIEQAVHFDLPGYFFLPQGCAPSIDVPLVAFLQLSVPLKTTHYEACLRSRVGQLSEVFAAKVGWLAGNIYSRVATPDFEGAWGKKATDELIEQLFNDYVAQDYEWLSKPRMTLLKAQVRKWVEEHPEKEMTLGEAGVMIQSLETEVDELARIILEVARTSELRMNADAEARLVGRAKNSERIKAFVRRLKDQ